MIKVLAPTAVLVACSMLIRAFLASFSPLGMEISTASLLAGVVHNGVLGAGVVLCAWYLATASAILIAQALAVLGLAPARLQQSIRRYGAPLLRRFATWTVAGTLALGTSTAAIALTEPHPVADSGLAITTEQSSSRNASFLVDLGWQPSPTVPAQPLAPSAPSAKPAPTANPAPAQRRTPAPPAGPARPLALPPIEQSVRDSPQPPLGQEAPRQEPGQPVPTQHTVQVGETLWGIAQTHLHSSGAAASPAHVAAYWPLLHQENFAEIGANPDLITPGLHLRIPPVEES